MKTLMVLLLLVSVASCSKDDDNLPSCIDTKLEAFKKDACMGSGDLTLWRFNGREVYCFNPGTCIADAAIEIYSEDCVLVCTMGTIAGVTNCEGLDWASNAIFLETLYEH